MIIDQGGTLEESKKGTMGIGNVISSSNISYFQTQVHNDCYHPQKSNGATDQLRNARWPMDDTLCDDLPPKKLFAFYL